MKPSDACKPTEEKYAVVLPCNQKDFGDFVAGLLGKPQRIKKRFLGSFEITSDEISSTFQLVEQRVHQQNDATLIQFHLDVQYDDNSSVVHTSLEDFLLYRELRPLVPTSIHVTWIYLIKFRDKDFPEKQTIEMSFGTGNSPWTEVGIHIRINHTARSWANDIESLLSGHALILLKSENRLKSFISDNSGKIGTTFGVIFFLLAVASAFLVSEGVASQQLTSVESVLSQSTIEVSQKVDFILTQYAKGVWFRFYFSLVWYIVVAFLVSVILGFWVSSAADNDPKSFLLFTAKAIEKRDDHIKHRRRKFFFFFITIAISVVTGVLANFIFAFVSEKWLIN